VHRGSTKTVTAIKNAIPIRLPMTMIAICRIRKPYSDVMRAGKLRRYVHWGGVLFFSASDNSDPNSNNRNYELIRQ
jgi:hypothetical protein